MIPPPKPGGETHTVDIREVVNAVFYQLRSGEAWQLPPHDFPNWSTVYEYFNRWSKDGTRKRINAHQHRELRVVEGCDLKPSAAIMDSQSVKTPENEDHAAMMQPRK